MGLLSVVSAAAAADFMHCCTLTHRNDWNVSAETVLSIQKPGASLALQTYLPRESQVCVTYVRTGVYVLE
jgi:hypothetical protein